MPVNDSYIEAMNAALDQARDALTHDDVPVAQLFCTTGKSLRRAITNAKICKTPLPTPKFWLCKMRLEYWVVGDSTIAHWLSRLSRV